MAGEEVVEASIETINNADLGRPYSADFIPMTGKDARSLFPAAKAPRKSTVNTWKSEFIEVDDTETLRANAGAWGIRGSVSTSSDTRFLVFRVKVVEYALEIDDATEPRTLDPTSTAAYYVRKIYYGRIFETIMSGSRESLNAQVSAGIQMLGPSFQAEYLKSRYKVKVTLKGKGLNPNSEALFANSRDEIMKAYASKDMGPPVPIIVEYRRIPGSKPDVEQPIDWTPPSSVAAASAAARQTKVRGLKVAGNSGVWTSTNLTVGPRDFVVGIAKGNVIYGKNYAGSRSAEADAAGPGGLEMQLGNSPVAAGKFWVTSGGAGEVKLRVRDTKWDDNSGGYEVMLIVLPEDLLKASDCQQQDDQGVLGSCAP